MFSCKNSDYATHFTLLASFCLIHLVPCGMGSSELVSCEELEKVKYLNAPPMRVQNLILLLNATRHDDTFRFSECSHIGYCVDRQKSLFDCKTNYAWEKMTVLDPMTQTLGWKYLQVPDGCVCEFFGTLRDESDNL